MGYVYSPRQLNAGEVATKESFALAYHMLESDLRELHRSGHIVGAKIHGGSAQGYEDVVGGDIDVLLVASSVNDFFCLSDIYAEIWKKTFVPVEFIPYPTKNAEKSVHSAERFFCERINQDKGVVVGTNPADIFRQSDFIPDEFVVKKDMDSRIRRLGSFSSKIMDKYSVDHCILLECLIRWPIYTALDMLRLKSGRYLEKEGLPQENKKFAKCIWMNSRKWIQPDYSRRWV